MKPMKEEKPEGMERWLLTYSDMITLLLLYFIIMFSMSKTDVNKFEELIQSLGAVFGGGKPGIVTPELTLSETGIMDRQSMPGQFPAGSKRSYQLAMSFEKTVSALRPAIEARKVRVTLEERGLVIILASDFYFKPGDAELSDDTKKTLDTIYPMLRDITNKIRIEGHTDNMPPTPEKPTVGEVSKYPSNWELSSQRAINVLKFIQSAGIPTNRLSAAAFAETRPIESNNTPEERAFNRRVDIVVITEGGE